VDLTASDWRAAAVLAAMRTSSNDPTRDPEHDRGALQNMVNDLQGSIGEIRLLRGLERALDGCDIRHYLFDPAGGKAPGVSDATDATVALPAATVTLRHHRTADAVRPLQRPASSLRLEAKCHLDLDPALRARLDARPKRDFAVNYDAVGGSVALNAVGLVPILAAPGRSTALFGRLIMLLDVLGWEAVEYGFNDPALRMPLATFAPHAWDRPWEVARALVAESPVVVDMRELIAIYRAATLHGEQLAGLPALDAAPGVAVASLAAHADRLLGMPRRPPGETDGSS
jgi:hypothetical protein